MEAVMMRRVARTLGWLLASLIIISSLPAQAAPAPAPRQIPNYNAPTSGSAPQYGYLYVYWQLVWAAAVPKHTIKVCAPSGCWSLSSNDDRSKYNHTYSTGLWTNPGDNVTVTLFNDNTGTWARACTAWPPGPSGAPPALTAAQMQSQFIGDAWEDWTDSDCLDVVSAVGYAPTPSGYHDGNSGVQLLPNCYAYGWATSGYTEQSPLSVRALVDGADVGLYGTANGYRSDTITAGVCQTGYCGFTLGLYSVISHGVNHAITIQAQDPLHYNWYNLNSTPKTINCTEASYGSYFYSSPSPSNLLVGGSAVSMYSYHYSINNGAGLNSVDYYVNCDPWGGTGGTWYYIGGTPFSGAPTTAYGSITLNPSSATSTCGGVLRGLHTFAENSYMVPGAYTGDVWSGSFWWMPWNYSSTQRTFTVLWDWDPPTTTPSYSGPAGANGWYTGQVIVTLSAYDNPTDVPNSGLNSTNVQLPGWSGYSTYINPFALTNQGANTIYYYSTDRVNNTEAVKNSTVYIDSVAPVSSYALTGSGSNGWYNTAVTFGMSASDSTSGVWHEYASLDGGGYQ